MQFFLAFVLFASSAPNRMIFDFAENVDLRNWKVVDDGVMGGRSAGTFGLDAAGMGVFQGFVSLENNGGFSSVRHPFPAMPVSPADQIVIRIKGDGKDYQLRVKNNTEIAHSYITTFSTTGDWQEISSPLKDLYPSFRGRRLDKPNFSHDSLAEIAFLIGNKKPESFQLLIDWIALK